MSRFMRLPKYWEMAKMRPFSPLSHLRYGVRPISAMTLTRSFGQLSKDRAIAIRFVPSLAELQPCGLDTMASHGPGRNPVSLSLNGRWWKAYLPSQKFPDHPLGEIFSNETYAGPQTSIPGKSTLTE